MNFYRSFILSFLFLGGGLFYEPPEKLWWITVVFFILSFIFLYFCFNNHRIFCNGYKIQKIKRRKKINLLKKKGKNK
ncbi:hypothetical protein KJ700_02375 [Patescibacteria group bacterium]|nr:hypothetical protein [Patescibacteria group bacterium]